MKKHPIGTIVNFCSNESRFIHAVLEQAQLFSEQVIVPVCDHFFDGTPENRLLLEQIYAAFPQCRFIEYPFIPQKIPKKIWKKIDPAHFWHSLARWVGYSALADEIEHVLFLDADEVPDGRRFAAWLDCSDYGQHTAFKLANYWYFRDTCYQATQFEDSIVLVQKRALEMDVILHPEERDAIYHLLPGPKRRHVTDFEGHPMFHHYSWVRTKDQMLQKVRSWGHKGDRDWAALVHEEFQSPFKGTDFIHHYTYNTVKPFVGDPCFEPKGGAMWKKIEPNELLALIKCKKIWNFLDF